MKNVIVAKSNKIIEASYRLSLNEQRVLLACISMIDTRSEITPKKEFKLDVLDFSNLFNLPHGSTYSYIKEGVDKLSEKGFKIRQSKNNYSEKINWTSKVKYYDDEGSIGIYFGEFAIPYLSNLKKEFTTYRLQNISKLTSIYSIRLYEILSQWKGVGKKSFQIEDFRKFMGVKDGDYKRIFDFKKKVLNVAVNQINEHTDINCNYIEQRTGRKITGITFWFGADQITQKELKEMNKEIKTIKRNLKKKPKNIS